MRSAYEVALARQLRKARIKFTYESKTFRGRVGSRSWNYTPDFYLPEYDRYLEVKSWYTWKIGRSRLVPILHRIRERGIKILLVTGSKIERMRKESVLDVLRLKSE